MASSYVLPHHMVRPPMEDMDRHGHISVIEAHGLGLLECHQSVQNDPSSRLVRSAHCPKHLIVVACREQTTDIMISTHQTQLKIKGVRQNKRVTLIHWSQTIYSPHRKSLVECHQRDEHHASSGLICSAHRPKRLKVAMCRSGQR